MKELSKQPFGPGVDTDQKDQQIKVKDKVNLTISVIGHELAGKKAIVENFLQNNFNDGQEEINIQQQQTQEKENIFEQINFGIKYYHTEFQYEQQMVNMTIKILHSNPMFNQLRLSHLRTCDGICIIYDHSRKDIGPEMMQYLYEVHLFKYQKPVYTIANHFKSKNNVHIFDSQNLIPDIKYTDVSLTNISSIQNCFKQITKDAIISKLKKPVFSNLLLNELSYELTTMELQEFELKLDFLKNKVTFDTLKSFCQTMKDQQQIIKMNLDIYNWGNYGKSTEEQLNKIGEQKINVKVKNSISSYINN